MLQRRRQGFRVTGVLGRGNWLDRRSPGGGVGWDPDGEEAAGKVSLLSPGQVQVAVLGALEEAPRLTPRRVVEGKQNVIVAIEDG